LRRSTFASRMALSRSTRRDGVAPEKGFLPTSRARAWPGSQSGNEARPPGIPAGRNKIGRPRSRSARGPRSIRQGRSPARATGPSCRGTRRASCRLELLRVRGKRGIRGASRALTLSPASPGSPRLCTISIGGSSCTCVSSDACS
jgi:hypothetical protein